MKLKKIKLMTNSTLIDHKNEGIYIVTGLTVLFLILAIISCYVKTITSIFTNLIKIPNSSSNNQEKEVIPIYPFSSRHKYYSIHI